MHREELLATPLAYLPAAQILDGLAADDTARRVLGIAHSMAQAHVGQERQPRSARTLGGVEVVICTFRIGRIVDIEHVDVDAEFARVAR